MKLREFFFYLDNHCIRKNYNQIQNSFITSNGGYSEPTLKIMQNNIFVVLP